MVVRTGIFEELDELWTAQRVASEDSQEGFSEVDYTEKNKVRLTCNFERENFRRRSSSPKGNRVSVGRFGGETVVTNGMAKAKLALSLPKSGGMVASPGVSSIHCVLPMGMPK